MKKSILIASLMILGMAAAASDRLDAARIADAIKRQENSVRWPYGIKDGHRHTQAQARRICLNTIRHAWSDWNAAGCPGDYINFLADQYCPASDDPQGNLNWKHNIKFFLK
jgi:hypothetical protein